MSGGVWLGAHKMCAPEEPCFDPFGKGLEACFGPKLIFINIFFSDVCVANSRARRLLFSDVCVQTLELGGFYSQS